MRILIVEDDIEIQQLVNYFFKRENYDTYTAGDGVTGLRAVKSFKPDLIVLDLMLPNLDGKNFTQIVREMSSEYGDPIIIMLTAKTEIDDVLEGLQIGADDYMKKPFDPRELVLRAKKLLAKKGKNVETDRFKEYKFQQVTIDEEKYLVKEGDKEIELSKKEFALLLLLVKNKGIVLSREKILDKVWESNYYAGDRSVDIYISKLREKVKSIAENIKTIKGVGYKLDEKK